MNLNKKLKFSLWMWAMVFVFGFQMSAYALSVGQDKLLAKRAAQVDGYRKLAELVKGLQIDSNTYVRDFVAESDQIQTSFDHFIKGAKVVGMPRYFEDGVCEVDVEMTLMQVIQALKTIAVEHSSPFGSHTHVFDEMVQYTQKKVIRVTGTGVPRPQQVSGGEPGEMQSPMSSPTAGIPGWENVTAQGRLMAQRAAKVDAYRNLAEHIKGIEISSNTYVRDFVAESDEINTRLDTFLKGVKQIGSYRYMPDGIAECDVEVALQTVVKELTTIRDWFIHRYPDHRWNHAHLVETKFEDIVKIYPKKFIRATGNGVVPEKYRFQAQQGTSSQPVVAQIPAWADRIVVAKGTGIPSEGVDPTEARVMAMRAAEMDARRNLAEAVYGVQINSETTMQDFVTQNDTIEAEVKTLIAGVKVSEPRYMEDGSVEVDAQLPLQLVWERIRNYIS